MHSTLAVHFLPELTTPAELAAGVVVVVDVLRASTTITTALASGAREVIPCLEVGEARQRAEELGRHSTGDNSNHGPLLGGERGGLPIDGFDLGNSPNEFTPQTVAGRSIVFTTTNGTKALLACTAAQSVLIGSFVNLSAVVRKLTGELPIHILCAGTRGRVTREDVLFAGSLVEKLVGTIVEEGALNDEARIACDVWCHAMDGVQPPDQRVNQRLAEVLRNTQGGRNLANVGLERDIVDAANFDRFDFAPELDSVQWRIVRPTA